MIATWVAIAIVVAVGGLLLFWHFSGTQVVSVTRPRNDPGIFDGISGVGHDSHSGHGVDGNGGGDGGSSH